MNSCYYTLFIFAVVIFLQCLSPTRAAKCHPDDEAGLLAFKSGITRDQMGILSDWKKGTKCCSWVGVYCNTDRVTALRIIGATVLGESYISGTISPSLAKLQHLEGVYLTFHPNITGSFPQFLFQLPKLKYVEFTGTSLFGPLPANFGALSQLEGLLLGDNQFTGPIPTSIYNLTRLTTLILSGNRFSGAIPDIFKSMKKLEHINLSGNRFSGKLPSSFASLAPTLTNLDLSQNNLSGTIPNYFSRFQALSALDLSKNQYSGVVPKIFANMSKLAYLDLSHNHLCGKLPVTKFPAKSFAANHCLCGSPLSPCKP